MAGPKTEAIYGVDREEWMKIWTCEASSESLAQLGHCQRHGYSSHVS